MPELPELSERELEILQLVATGAGNKEIAQRLSISANTVKVHLRNIFAKIGVISRTEAAMYAVRLGIVDSGAVRMAEPAVVSASEEEDSPVGTALPAVSVEAHQPLENQPPARRGFPLRWILPLAGVLFLAIFVFFWQRPRFQNSGLAVAASPTPASRWRPLASLSQPRSHLSLVVTNGRLYAIGGRTTEGATDLVEIYDPQSNQWSPAPSKPTAVMEINAGVLGGRIYVPGGRLPSGETTNVLEVYDPRLEQWELRAPMPIPLSAYAVCVFEGRLYIFGGWDGKRFVNTVYAYDPIADSWAQQVPMPTARGYAGAAAAGGKIYVIGGYDGVALRANEVYQPGLDESREQPWASAEPIPAGRYAMGIAGASDLIYLVGGIAENAEIPVIAYQPSSDAWSEQEKSSVQQRSGLGLAAFETFLFAVGGETDDGLTAANEAYQVSYVVVIPLIR